MFKMLIQVGYTIECSFGSLENANADRHAKFILIK